MKRLLVLATVMLLVAACGGGDQTAATEAMLKDFAAAVEALDAEKAASFYMEDAVYRDPDITLAGRERVQDMYEFLRDRGDKLEIETVFGTPNRGVIEGIWTTTNREGNTVRIRYCAIYQIQDGKISREHLYFDGRLLR